MGSGEVGAKTLVSIGTYDIVLHSDFEAKPISKSILIRAGEETVVDITQELGVLQLADHPQFKQRLTYHLYSHGEEVGLTHLSIGIQYCGVPGEYQIRFRPREYIRSDNIFTSGFFITNALFPEDKVGFDVEIKAGEKTIVGPETWSKQLGLISFSSKSANPRIDIKVDDLQTGTQGDYYRDLSSSESYWILAGKYTIIVTKPYIGLAYEDVEIKVGEETVLELPE